MNAEFNGKHSLVRLRRACKEGKGEVLILVHGYLHGCAQKRKDYRNWTGICRKAGFRGEVRGYHWDSIDYPSMVGGIAEILSKIPNLEKTVIPVWAEKLLTRTQGKWEKAKVRAENAGICLASRLSNLKDRKKISIIGHSLGCKVIKTCIESICPGSIRLGSVYLLGAAVSAGEKWDRVKEIIDGEIFNFSSRDDSTLKYFFRTASLFELFSLVKQSGISDLPSRISGCNPFKVAGLRGFENNSINILNIDVTKLVSHHQEYEHRFAEFFDFEYGWPRFPFQPCTISSINITSNEYKKWGKRLRAVGCRHLNSFHSSLSEMFTQSS